MKRVFTIFSIFCIVLAICAKNQAKADEGGPPRGGTTTEQLLDLAAVKIQSPVTREILRCESIRVRRSHTTYMPKGLLPVLKMEKLGEQQCVERLNNILNVHGGRKPGRIKNVGGALAARLPDASCWIHPASGGYKFTVTRNAMTKPTQLRDFKEAVQKCLDHIASNELVELTRDEELDIVTVSVVNNVLSDVNSPEKPKEQFLSDYYVSFGRRFRGIPIVGSYLTLRIDGGGEVVMVSSNWRRIEAVEEEKARITEKSLRELIFNSPRFREMFGSQQVRPEDINIAQIRAGYIEAPFNYVQERLRPGCLVSFWVGETRDEMDAQLLLALEELGSPELLLGKRDK
jgi:hypothetical protein